MKVVLWGGLAHDTTVDVDESPTDPGLPLRYDVQVEADENPEEAARYGSWPAALRPRRVVSYDLFRLADPTGSIARRKGDPPFWYVGVVADASPTARDRWLRESQRPFVDGPREPIPTLTARYSERMGPREGATRRSPAAQPTPVTLSPIWTVWCDAGDAGDASCHHWCQETGMTAPEAWAKARRSGWHKRARRHVCPACWRLGRR